jgi:predicted alpha/beta-hydrolase family hydrolase
MRLAQRPRFACIDSDLAAGPLSFDMVESAEWHVVAGPRALAVLFEPAHGEGHPNIVFVCAHGAGGHRDDALMASLAAELRTRGIGVVRFNFPYRESGLARPDPMPILQAALAAVADHVRSELRPDRLLLGGRSMGGRVASILAAQGFACDGLLLLAYPLHPAGRHHQLRDQHLPGVAVPVLCFNGTRDPLCRQDLMEQVVQRAGSRWTMHWLEGADHSFHVLKRSGRTDEQVMREVGEVSQGWVKSARCA